MLPDILSILENLSLIYEDLDIDNVERKFVDLISHAFAFDRTAFFFVKHRKNLLKGKLGKGFDPEAIRGIELPLGKENLLSTPLISGSPYWSGDDPIDDPLIRLLGLDRFVLIPVQNKRRVACWEIKKCAKTECAAYGKKWLRCWLVADALCCDGEEGTEEKAQVCAQCPIFNDHDLDALEGILLVDNSLSQEPIRREVITALSIIAHTVGMAINNAKLFTKALNEAIKDPLTSLHNRRYFDERLMDEIDRVKRYQGALNLIICDIDHFKKVNDNHGHLAGDKVLCQLGAILKNRLRKSDVVARYGGEEFALLIINTDKETAVKIAEQMRAEIEKHLFQIPQGELTITASLGVATFVKEFEDAERFLLEADRALYLAKHNGRNQVCST